MVNHQVYSGCIVPSVLEPNGTAGYVVFHCIQIKTKFVKYFEIFQKMNILLYLGGGENMFLRN